MKTMICATLVALACAASSGLPAAADDASAARMHPTAAATLAQPRPVSSGQFHILSDVGAVALSKEDMGSTRGARKTKYCFLLRMF